MLNNRSLLTPHIFIALTLLIVLSALSSLSARTTTAALANSVAPTTATLSVYRVPALSSGKATFLAPLPASQSIHVVMALNPPNPAAEDQFLKDIQTRGNPLYHHFLTSDEWNTRFAPSPTAEQATVDWAKSHGLTVTQRYNNRLLVDVDARAASIEQAFNIHLGTYRLGGDTFYANDRNPTLPATLAGIVQNVMGLNSYQVGYAHSGWFGSLPPAPRPSASMSTLNSGHANSVHRAVVPEARGTMSPELYKGYISPEDLWGPYAYDVGPLYNQGHCCYPNMPSGATDTPKETSIAIATACNFLDSDLSTFASTFFHNGQSMADHWQGIDIDGGPGANSNCANSNGGGGLETTLDMEYATAMSNSFGCYCSTAKIYLYKGPAQQVKNGAPYEALSTMVDEWNQVVSDNKVDSFSTSWGCYETCWGSSSEDTGHNVFNNMVGLGITPAAAAGDLGSYDNPGNASAVPPISPSLEVDYPAADPDVIDAGGSELHLNSDGSYNFETTWNNGGGGCSSHFGQPGYQQGVSTGCANRAVPDVSLNASGNTLQALYFNGSWVGVFGTSEVAPELAGLFANINAYLMSLGNICYSGGNSPCAGIGNANYDIYDQATSPNGGRAAHYPFYDITTGNNDDGQVDSNGNPTPYYNAGTGYDMATGWGSLNAFQFARSIMWENVDDAHSPGVTFSGPQTGYWYNADQNVSWTVTDYPNGDVAASGPSGFSQYWDSPETDSFKEPTPLNSVISDSFYDRPQFPNATSGYLALSWAGQGCHTAHVEAWDNIGNYSYDQKYGPICYDTITPQTTATLNGAAPRSTDYAAPVKVAESASDPGATCSPSPCSPTGSGVATTYYALDGAYSDYTGPFNVTTAGSHTLKIFSADKAGNVESAATITFTVTVPSTSTNSTASVTTNSATLSGTVNLNGIAQGCAYFVYHPNGNPSSSVDTPGQTISGSGTHTISASVSSLNKGTAYDASVAVEDQACGGGGTQTVGSPTAFLTPMPLQGGWNLTSIPTTQDTATAAAFASSLNGSGTLNGHLKALAVLQQGRWTLYVPGYSKDFNLTFGQGIAVLSDDNASHPWTASGSVLSSGGTIVLHQGWNVVGPAYESLTEQQICAKTGAKLVSPLGGPAYICGTTGGTTQIPNAQAIYIEMPANGTWTQP